MTSRRILNIVSLVSLLSTVMMPYCCHQMSAPSAGPSYWTHCIISSRGLFLFFWSHDLLFPESYFLDSELCISRWFKSLNGRACVLAAKTTDFLHIWFGVDLFDVGRHYRSKPLLHVIVRAVNIAESDELSGSCCCGSPSSWVRRGGWGWLLIFYLPWEDFAALRIHLRSHVRQMTSPLCMQ